MILKVDPELQSAMPALTELEKELLEQSLVDEGCREPIYIWNGIIIDGHNRYEICSRLGIGFITSELFFKGREEASDWIDKNQLGRRNLTPDQADIIKGRRYNRQKKMQGGTGANQHTEQKCQNDTSAKCGDVATQLAKEYGVSRSTIIRDGKKAATLDELAKTDPEAVADVINGKKKLKDVLPERMPCNTKKEHIKETYSSGLIYCGYAISQMERIHPKDTELYAAFDKMRMWLDLHDSRKRNAAA